jgi:hypothetical protein
MMIYLIGCSSLALLAFIQIPLVFFFRRWSRNVIYLSMGYTGILMSHGFFIESTANFFYVLIGVDTVLGLVLIALSIFFSLRLK